MKSIHRDAVQPLQNDQYSPRLPFRDVKTYLVELYVMYVVLQSILCALTDRFLLYDFLFLLLSRFNPLFSLLPFCPAQLSLPDTQYLCFPDLFYWYIPRDGSLNEYFATCHYLREVQSVGW